jgi:hypothetical protein
VFWVERNSRTFSAPLSVRVIIASRSIAVGRYA